TGYYGVLDIGVSAAVGRFIARYHAQHNVDAINEVMSTAFALLIVACVAALAVTIGVSQLFPVIFHVSSSQRADAYVAVVLVGLNLALMFPFSVFSGFLWGHERFDLINFVDIPAVILRAAVTLWLLGNAERPL